MAITVRHLIAIIWCIAVVESWPSSGDSHQGKSASMCELENKRSSEASNADDDSCLLLQTSVAEGLTDYAFLHHRRENQDGVHLLDSPSQNQTHEKQSEKRSPIWTHPLVLGVLLGFFLIGPDHLGTLMAMSTLTSGFISFKRGFYWGAGHSIGVMLLCPIFLALEYFSSNNVSNKTWEYYGDIFIGVSMIAVSFYFIYYQDSYLQMDADGFYVAKDCACCPSMPGAESTSRANWTVMDRCPPCPPAKGAISLTTPAPNNTSSERLVDDSASIWTWQFGGALGVLQGLCCPAGMTAGTGFMSRVTATASTPMLIGFLIVFFVSSGVGSGMISLGWGLFTMRGSRSCISGRVLFLATCLLLMLFGVLWLIAHSMGMLDYIDFGDKIHDKLVDLQIFCEKLHSPSLP